MRIYEVGLYLLGITAFCITLLIALSIHDKVNDINTVRPNSHRAVLICPDGQQVVGTGMAPGKGPDGTTSTFWWIECAS